MAKLGKEVVPTFKEFATREYFLDHYSNFVKNLYDYQKGLVKAGDLLENLEEHCSAFQHEEEKQLFVDTYGLFCIEQKISPHNMVPEVADFLMNGDLQDITIEMGGPLAVGKSTFAEFLAPNIDGMIEIERFEAGSNIFLAPSYSDVGLMLRTQIKFLLDNIKTGLRGKFHEGRWVRDTSVWSDIFVFMEWRRQKGIVTEDEYETYMETVRILEPLIVRPDLLLVLQPTSVQDLREGLEERIAAQPETRSMEREVTTKDLEIVTGATERMVTILEDLGINVLSVKVNPKEVYNRSDLKYSLVYQIRQKLGILDEYLTKTPEEAKSEVVRIFAKNHEAQLVFIHSKSMFTAKTTTLNMIAEELGHGSILAFQPRAAIRPGWSNQEENVIDRNGGKTSAITVETNSLSDIYQYIVDNGVSTEEVKYIFIDEVMLFVGDDGESAIKSLEDLRRMGFNVVCDGIDYTFQERPFTFTHEILTTTKETHSWHQVEMGTRCKYCSELAQGTRRILKTGEVAPYHDTAFQPGDEEYEPVCCSDEHSSCVDKPIGFVRQELPI